MRLYLDTSAMAKLFVEEEGSAAMLEACQQPGCEIWLLDLAGVEFSSLIWRRVREKRLLIDPAR